MPQTAGVLSQRGAGRRSSGAGGAAHGCRRPEHDHDEDDRRVAEAEPEADARAAACRRAMQLARRCCRWRRCGRRRRRGASRGCRPCTPSPRRRRWPATRYSCGATTRTSSPQPTTCRTRATKAAIPTTLRRSSRDSSPAHSRARAPGRLGRVTSRRHGPTLGATGSQLQRPPSDGGLAARDLVVGSRRTPGRSARRWPSITSSVSSRRALPAGTPAYASTAMGSPKRTVTFARRGSWPPRPGCPRCR